MLLRYINAEGKLVDYELGTRTIIIGRSQEADIVLEDEKASRVHCEIRPWDNEYVIKDLKSRNSTFVNDNHVDVATLHIGDRIRIGSTEFAVERKAAKGAKTIFREVSKEMEQGKGYRTILREIVQSTHDKDKPNTK